MLNTTSRAAYRADCGLGCDISSAVLPYIVIYRVYTEYGGTDTVHTVYARGTYGVETKLVNLFPCIVYY
jgi:hypothetical protein